jgi:DNA replication protein DnaC
MEFLESLLKAEAAVRSDRSRVLLTRMAGFSVIQRLEPYDFQFAVGAPKALIQQLASLAFIERGENIVLIGPSGWANPIWPSPWGTRLPRPGSNPALLAPPI